MAVKTASGSDLRNSLSSGLVLLNTTSFSGVAAQNVDSLFSSTYLNYKIIIRATYASGDLKFQGRVGGSTIAGAAYGHQRVRGDNTTMTVSRSSGNSDWFISEQHSVNSQVVIELGGPNVAENTTGVVQDSRGFNTINLISLRHDANDQFDGLRIYPTSGTMTGTVSVYGYNK
jgi:hypothetical protein